MVASAGGSSSHGVAATADATASKYSCAAPAAISVDKTDGSRNETQH